MWIGRFLLKRQDKTASLKNNKKVLQKYNANCIMISVDIKQVKMKKFFAVLKQIGKVLLLILECIGYIIGALFGIAFFLDLFDKKKK